MRRWKWMRVNGYRRRYAVRQGRFGDEFVKIFGRCIWIPTFSVAITILLALAVPVLAANFWLTPSGENLQGHVVLCLNGSGQGVPCSTASPLPVAVPLAASGAAGYPTGATPIGATFSGADTTTAAATLAAAAAKFTYVCGFTVSGLGATGATTVATTVASLVGAVTATYTYVFVAGATLQNTSLAVTYTPCVPGNAVNTGIAVTVPGAAGNTATQINAWGYQL